MAFQWQVLGPQLRVDRNLGLDLGHVGVDVTAALGARDRHAVMAVAHEVQIAHAEDGDRRHVATAPLCLGDPLPPATYTSGRRPELPVELLGAVDCADDRLERDRLEALAALADPPERGDDLLERQDEVEVRWLAP